MWYQIINPFQSSKKKTILKFKTVAMETVLIGDYPYYHIHLIHIEFDLIVDTTSTSYILSSQANRFLLGVSAGRFL